MKKLAILLALALVGICSLAGAQTETTPADKPATTEAVYHNNVMIVMDDSGSMADSMRDSHGKNVPKIVAAKLALKEVVKTIPDGTFVGLVSFGHDWLFKLGLKDEVKINAGIDKLSPGGSTPLGQFMKFGADCLLKQRDLQHGYGSYRLLVVTDGQATDADLMERYTPEIMARGITIDVIGVNMDQDHTLAKKVHSYRNAKNPESLKQAVTEVLAEVPNNSDGSANTEAYDLIAGLPDGFAEQAINALANSGNQPIGERPTPKPKEVKQQPPQPTNAGQAAPTGNQTPANAAQPPSDDGPPVMVIIIVVCLLVVAIVVVAVISNL